MLRSLFRSSGLLLAVVAVVLSSMLVSCGPEESARTVDLGAATVRWVTWDSGSAAESLLIEQFREQYPQVEFKREGQNGPTESYLKTPPDLLNIDIDYDYNKLAKEGKLADLSELWGESGLQEQIPASLQRMSERDGKQFYMPFGFGWIGIYYNKEIFAKHNLQPPENWEEFLQVCETLALAGETPLALAGSEPWASYEWFEYLDLRINGAEFHRGLMAGRESFEDERVRKVLETWKSLFDFGYFSEDAKLVQGLAALTSLARGEKVAIVVRSQAAMALSDAYYASQLPAPFMQQLGFFRFPIIDPAIPVAESIDAFGYVVPVGADNPSHAIEFLRGVGSANAQQLVAHNGLFSSVTYAPARIDVDTSGMRVDQLGAIDMIKNADEAVPYLWLALPDATWGAMQYHFNRFVSERDVDLFMSKLEEARLAGIKKGWLEGGQ